MKNKNKKSKLKTRIKNSITIMASVTFIVSASCLDSTNTTPFCIVCIISLAWLILSAYVNGYMEV